MEHKKKEQAQSKVVAVTEFLSPFLSLSVSSFLSSFSRACFRRVILEFAIY